jgi:hypothetical protein
LRRGSLSCGALPVGGEAGQGFASICDLRKNNNILIE